MHQPRSVASPQAPTPPREPLIFISHDSQDAPLAAAFSELLANVSAGCLKSFRASDNKGTQGIAYGTEWYPTIMQNLGEASDVVCLLTPSSIARPWILYEAGVAKGKPNTQLHGIKLGIPAATPIPGPFQQFQTCDDQEDSLSQLLTQFLRRLLPTSEPNPSMIRQQVRRFKRFLTNYLPSPTKLTPSTIPQPNTLQKLEKNWRDYVANHPEQSYSERFKLYSFCGLKDEHPWQEDSEDEDLENVYFLWADAGAGSSIAAQVIREGDKRTQVRFTNMEGGHPSNIAFRLRGTRLLYSEHGFKTLHFLTRIPSNISEFHLEEVQMGFRIVDALNTHWKYSRRDGYMPSYVSCKETGEWTPCTIDLSHGTGDTWKVFEADGNYLYHDKVPDFTMILALVIEVGKRNARGPGDGTGIIEFKDFTVE